MWQCVMHVVDCLLSHVPPYHVTAAKCLLIGPQHTQLHERAIDILKQVDDVIHLLHFFVSRTITRTADLVTIFHQL